MKISMAKIVVSRVALNSNHRILSWESDDGPEKSPLMLNFTISLYVSSSGWVCGIVSSSTFLNGGCKVLHWVQSLRTALNVFQNGKEKLCDTKDPHTSKIEFYVFFYFEKNSQ